MYNVFPDNVDLLNSLPYPSQRISVDHMFFYTMCRRDLPCASCQSMATSDKNLVVEVKWLRDGF